jgi:hypothetical protein
MVAVTGQAGYRCSTAVVDFKAYVRGRCWPRREFEAQTDGGLAFVGLDLDADNSAAWLGGIGWRGVREQSIRTYTNSVA